MTKCAGCKITFSSYDAYGMHSCLSGADDAARLSLPRQILSDYELGKTASVGDAAKYIKSLTKDAPVVGVKYDQEKPDMSLISSIAITKVAEVLTYGKKKYTAHNWRAGLAWSRVLSASLRHIFSYLGGESLDPETGKSHIAHAVCCLMMLLEFEETKKDFDDRFTQPNKEPK